MGNCFAAQPSQETFTCVICIETFDYHTQCFKGKHSNSRPHPICNNCISKYIRAKLDNKNTAQIPCPAPNCSRFLDPQDCRDLVGRKLFVRWCDLLCEFAVKDMNKTYCPNAICSSLILNECGGNVKKAACPNCKLVFCFRCKIPWRLHAWFRCRGLDEMNDDAFKGLAERKQWMRCPRCHYYVERTQGCNHILCRCGSSFCYGCGRPGTHDGKCPGDTFCCGCGCVSIIIIALVFMLIILFVL